MEPPIPDGLAEEPVPDFLSPEQQELFRRARAAAGFLMGCETASVDDFPLADGSRPDQSGAYETVTLENGWTYLVSRGRFQRWEDFQSMLDGLFTRPYQEELLTAEMEEGGKLPLFTSTGDGCLCFLDLSRGSSLEYGLCGAPDRFTLVRRTEDEIVFELVGHYVELEEGDATSAALPAAGEYTKSYPIHMERTDQGWRFSEFHVAY